MCILRFYDLRFLHLARKPYELTRRKSRKPTNDSLLSPHKSQERLDEMCRILKRVSYARYK